MFRKFLRNDSANFAVFTAIAVLPLLGSAALAVDYTRAIFIRSVAQSAADASVLAAAHEAQQLIGEGVSKLKAEANSKSLGEEMFSANVGALAADSAVSMQVKVHGGIVAVTAKWTGTMNSFLGGMVGKKTLQLAIDAEARTVGPGYAEIHFVIDNSSSMSIGASDADIAIMANRINCAFACHMKGSMGTGNQPRYAREAGARLRIDVAKDAVANTVGFLVNNSKYGAFTYALHTFSNSVTTIVDPTLNPSVFRAALTDVDLNREVNEGGTDFHAAIPSLVDIVGTSGAGRSATDRKKIVILVTDGTETSKIYAPGEDRTGMLPNPDFVVFEPAFESISPTQSLDQELCDGLKAADILVMTMQVVPIRPKAGIGGMSKRVAFVDEVLKPKSIASLEACASSPSYARSAESPEAIWTALRQLAGLIVVGKLRLTE